MTIIKFLKIRLTIQEIYLLLRGFTFPTFNESIIYTEKSAHIMLNGFSHTEHTPPALHPSLGLYESQQLSDHPFLDTMKPII